MIQLNTRDGRDSAHGPDGPPVAGGYKVDISRGERIGRVSSEWFSRPDDERYLSLSALYDAVRSRADRATARTVETSALRVEASRGNAERLALVAPGREQPVAPTHWSFGQMCGMVGAPAGWRRGPRGDRPPHRPPRCRGSGTTAGKRRHLRPRPARYPALPGPK
jgi:hypothetical protein